MRLRLKEIRRAKKLSQETVAERLGRSAAQISRWENNRDGISTKMLADVAAAYGVQLAEMFEPSDVQVVGKVGEGAEILAGDGDPPGQPGETATRPAGVTGALVAVRVAGDAMEDRFFDGDLLFYSRDMDAADAEVVGRFCVVNTDDGRLLVKKVLRGKRWGTWRLESPNTPAIDDVHLRWAAPIKAVVSK